MTASFFYLGSNVSPFSQWLEHYDSVRITFAANQPPMLEVCGDKSLWAKLLFPFHYDMAS